MKFKVFVSYSSKDKSEVENLRNQLSSTPIDLYVADHSMPASEDIQSHLKSAIRNCDLFIVIWSSNAKNSNWVQQEIGNANTLSKRILPLVIEKDVELTGFIRNIKGINSFEDKSKALVEAQEIVRNLYNKKIADNQKIIDKKKKEKETLFIAGAGALLLWALNSN